MNDGVYAFNPTIETNGKTANKWAIGLGIGSAATLVLGSVVLITMPSKSYSSPTEAPTSRRDSTPSLAPVIGVGFMGAGAGWSF